jgi:acyl CoA:acetate/3-ketoacid CoA transferase
MTAGGLELSLDGGTLTILREGKNKKFVPELEHVTFSGRMAKQRHQNVLYVTERAVIKLEPEGLTVIEIAPGIDLERDVLGQAAIPLRVSPNLALMDARLFQPEPFGLQL